MPARTRAFVACGRPLPGHELVVVNDKGRPLSDREIGHILIRGPSVMAGYFANRQATDEVMSTDGFLRTGDMGYWLDGEIVITGRAKDLILLNGRNIWPQDIEWAVEQLEDLRSGDVAAFAVETDEGEDKVVVLVECRTSDPLELEQLRIKVARRVREVAGIDSRRAPCGAPPAIHLFREAVALGRQAALSSGPCRYRAVVAWQCRGRPGNGSYAIILRARSTPTNAPIGSI